MFSETYQEAKAAEASIVRNLAIETRNVCVEVGNFQKVGTSDVGAVVDVGTIAVSSSVQRVRPAIGEISLQPVAHFVR